MTLTFDDQHLTVPCGISISWAEVVAVHADKIDAKTHVVAIVTLDHECGEFIEIATDEEGFDALSRCLHEYLPLPQDWYQQIEKLPVGEGATLMRRGDGTA